MSNNQSGGISPIESTVEYWINPPEDLGLLIFNDIVSGPTYSLLLESLGIKSSMEIHDSNGVWMTGFKGASVLIVTLGLDEKKLGEDLDMLMESAKISITELQRDDDGSLVYYVGDNMRVHQKYLTEVVSVRDHGSVKIVQGSDSQNNLSFDEYGEFSKEPKIEISFKEVPALSKETLADLVLWITSYIPSKPGPLIVKLNGEGCIPNAKIYV